MAVLLLGRCDMPLDFSKEFQRRFARVNYVYKLLEAKAKLNFVVGVAIELDFELNAKDQSEGLMLVGLCFKRKIPCVAFIYGATLLSDCQLELVKEVFDTNLIRSQPDEDRVSFANRVADALVCAIARPQPN